MNDLNKIITEICCVQPKKLRDMTMEEILEVVERAEEDNKMFGPWFDDSFFEEIEEDN